MAEIYTCVGLGIVLISISISLFTACAIKKENDHSTLIAGFSGLAFAFGVFMIFAAIGNIPK